MAQSRRERERQARGDEIVAAAEALFAAHGYAGASMDEIARAAEFTKRTVYQYFASKEELFYAVVLRGMRQLLAYVEAAAGAAGAAAGAAASVGEAITGRERLRRIQAAAYRCTCDYPATFRLMDDVRYAPSDPENSPAQREIVALNGRIYTLMREAIEDGVRDGTVRGDLSGPGELSAYFFVTTGAYARLAGLGHLYAARLGTTPEALAESIMALTDRLAAPDEESAEAH